MTHFESEIAIGMKFRGFITLSISILCILVFSMTPVLSQHLDYRRSSSAVDTEERDNINVYKHASAAVVTIRSSSGSGSGCIIDPSGIIVTNRHVIGRNRTLTVKLLDESTYQASLLDLDNDDLALLKIHANKKFPYVRMGDSSKIEVGQRVLAIGNPFGLERTLTTGIISRIDYKMNRIQTDAAINPGNSGGPLMNSKGELIGINQAILNPSGRSSAGIGFAIPSNTVKRLLSMSRNAKIAKTSGNSGKFFRDYSPDTKSYSAPRPPSYSPYSSGRSQNLPSTVYKNKVFLGLAGQSTSDGRVVVLGIAPGSPAQKAGLRFRDIILAVDSIKVQKFDDIGFALNKKKPGDTINLLYMRNGVVNNSAVKLIPRN